MRRALLIAVMVIAVAPATAGAQGAFVSPVAFTDPDGSTVRRHTVITLSENFNFSQQETVVLSQDETLRRVGTVNFNGNRGSGTFTEARHFSGTPSARRRTRSCTAPSDPTARRSSAIPTPASARDPGALSRSHSASVTGSLPRCSFRRGGRLHDATGVLRGVQIPGLLDPRLLTRAGVPAALPQEQQPGLALGGCP